MPPFDPSLIRSPKSRVNKVIAVIHNGLITGTNISVVELELKNGTIVFGFRWDISYWSSNPNLGYPSSRGNPTWFIIPKPAMEDLLNTLKTSLPEFDK
jgi:hypothetical protein